MFCPGGLRLKALKGWQFETSKQRYTQCFLKLISCAFLWHFFSPLLSTPLDSLHILKNQAETKEPKNQAFGSSRGSFSSQSGSPKHRKIKWKQKNTTRGQICFTFSPVCKIWPDLWFLYRWKLNTLHLQKTIIASKQKWNPKVSSNP